MEGVIGQLRRKLEHHSLLGLHLASLVVVVLMAYLHLVPLVALAVVVFLTLVVLLASFLGLVALLAYLLVPCCYYW